MCFVVLFVLLSAGTSSLGASFFAPIITELMQDSPQMWVVYKNIIIIACIYVVGGLSSFAYNRIMMYVAQGTLKKMRDEMFAKMQNLPLKYFDSTTHGDLMSLYTNDIDTMRQLLSQTIPQLISSGLTIIFIFSLMVFYSFTLTLVILFFLAVMVLVIKSVGGKSAKYFLKQQESMGKLNGFVEEMTEGQKVIKVFCH